MTPKKAPARLPLTWSILSQQLRVMTSVDGERVMWLGRALSFFLLCRASELRAYADNKFHPEFFPTRKCLTFLQGEVQVAFEKRSSANAVQVRLVASKNDQKKAVAKLPEQSRRPGRKVGGFSGSFRSTAVAT